MKKNFKEVKTEKTYFGKYREIRKFAGFSFDKDLRKVKNDSDFSPSEKAAITRTWQDYLQVRENVRNGSAQIVKPRKRKGETENKYKKRVKDIREKNNPTFNSAKFAVAFVPKGSSIRFDKNNQMITRRPNNVLVEYVYHLSDNDRMEFIFDPEKVIKDKIELHKKLHPRKPPQLVGLATHGFPWKLGAANNYKTMAKYFLEKQAEYLAQDDSVDIGSFISGILIRA